MEAIDLFYADESGVCTEGYVPYGWQFKEEAATGGIWVPASRDGKRLNCFALINRQSHCHWTATTHTIDSAFLIRYLDDFSWHITKQTVVVIDQASMHRSQAVKERLPYWRRRGLWLFYLPPYSPHLNLCETLWRLLKGKWLNPHDYLNSDSLFYATTKVLNAVGSQLFIHFSHSPFT
jgi:transposase